MVRDGLHNFNANWRDAECGEVKQRARDKSVDEFCSNSFAGSSRVGEFNHFGLRPNVIATSISCSFQLAEIKQENIIFLLRTNWVIRYSYKQFKVLLHPIHKHREYNFFHLFME
jgi:hypothetical protein